MPDTSSALQQIDALLEDFGRARAGSQYDDFSGGSMPDYEKQAIATRLMAGIRRLAPPGSDYVRRAEQIDGYPGHVIENVGGILQALRADIDAGYMQSYAELVHADVFADFLEMASELHTKGYKDAAAVIAGSVLEEHLRKLADKSVISTERPDGSPKKADTLNGDLAREDVYNKLVQKGITAWLDLRNKAAHAEYDAYDQSQVAALIRDVRDFMIRHPA